MRAAITTRTSGMKTLFKKIARFVAALVLALPLLHEARADTVTYYHNDLLGSPVAATNQAGQVIWRESYRPYGERLVKDSQAQGNDVWYTSKPQDADTGLVYLGARYYDPVIGRFISTDPVGFDEKNVHSFNRYTYANNNPYKFVDPDGRNPILIGMGVGALIGGGLNAAEQYTTTGTIRWGGAGGVIDAAGDGAMFGMLGGMAAGRVAAFGKTGEETLKTTAHGAERIAGAGATRGGVLSLEQVAEARASGRVMTQADGATVRILQSEQGRFNVVVESERGLITSFENLSQKSLDRLARNYNWVEP
jgi:RHS repeat-associated protein